MIDIIIPTYNNKQGLIKTIQSIPKNKNLLITIIDDCSTQMIDYSDLEKQYKIIKLQKNVGPGAARQYGINNTNEPYIMFIDTGDYFFDNIFNNIINIITNDSETDVFAWQHISEKSKKVSKNTDNHLHGKVYKREFLNNHNIQFCKESSYANEDIGFNRICRLLTKIKFFNQPIYMWTNDPNSLTRRDNNSFSYKNQNIGLAFNGIHIYNTCKGQTAAERIELECGEIMGALYMGVIKTVQERPEFINEAWFGARLFYKKIYQPNNYNVNIALQSSFSKLIAEVKRKKDIWIKPVRLNIVKFLQELDKYEVIPDYYLTTK